MDAGMLAEKVVEDMNQKTLYQFALETLIDAFGKLSEHELLELADTLGYGDYDEAN